MLGIDLLDKGGAVMWVLALLSVYALAVIVYKCWQFYKENMFSRQSADGVLMHIKHGNRAAAKQELEAIDGPLARIIRVSLECVENREMSLKSKEAEVTRVGTADLHHMESYLRGLEIAAAIAPLLGLLGTVIGLIDSFSKLGIGSARVDPTMLAGGIWAALLTTAAGLAIAIPALAAHSFFDSLIEKLKMRMKDASVQILALEDEHMKEESQAASEDMSDKMNHLGSQIKEAVTEVHEKFEAKLLVAKEAEEKKRDAKEAPKEIKKSTAQTSKPSTKPVAKPVAKQAAKAKPNQKATAAAPVAKAKETLDTTPAKETAKGFGLIKPAGNTSGENDDAEAKKKVTSESAVSELLGA